MVVASIHQPSTSTFMLFDKLYLLSHGRLCYGGPASGVQAHFENLGYPMPIHINPAEFLLDLINVDFSHDQDISDRRLDQIQKAASISPPKLPEVHDRRAEATEAWEANIRKQTKPSFFLITWVLLQRNYTKSYRDVVVYGIRIAMYLGSCAAFQRFDD